MLGQVFFNKMATDEPSKKKKPWTCWKNWRMTYRKTFKFLNKVYVLIWGSLYTFIAYHIILLAKRVVILRSNSTSWFVLCVIFVFYYSWHETLCLSSRGVTSFTHTFPLVIITQGPRNISVWDICFLTSFNGNTYKWI